MLGQAQVEPAANGESVGCASSTPLPNNITVGTENNTVDKSPGNVAEAPVIDATVKERTPQASNEAADTVTCGESSKLVAAVDTSKQHSPALETSPKINGKSHKAVEKPFSWLHPHVQFVVVFVGPEEVPFGIQTDFICSRSTYFKEKFKGPEASAQLEHIARLPDSTPEIFGYTQNYLYTGNVIADWGALPSYEVLIGVWKLGHMLDIDGLCDKTLDVMRECRRRTERIPATPLLVRVWRDTPEGCSIRSLLLSWAAEYMRASDARAAFARSLPQEVLSELVVTMSSLDSVPVVRVPPRAGEPSSEQQVIRRKSVHYLEEDSDEERSRALKKSRRASGPSLGTQNMERKAPVARKQLKPLAPRRRTSTMVLSENEITTARKLEFCADLLDRMLSGPGFWTRLVGPFKDPVDPERDQVPDYFAKVTKPMDLSTIKAKMDRREYTNEDEFASDVRLIFSNCYTYWTRGDAMWQACEKFQKTFEDKYGQMIKTISKLLREPAE